MPRTIAEWKALFRQIDAGYVAGGEKERQYELGLFLAMRLEQEEIIKPGDRIVDAGCGNGRLAAGLTGRSYQYIGFDVVQKSIQFCQRIFKDEEPDFKFVWLNVRNSHYYSAGAISPDQAVWPVENDWADAVIASSLFSHLGNLKFAARYVSEAFRVLNPAGRFYSTWFTDPPNRQSTSEARTVYKLAAIRDLLTEKGFSIVWESEGLSIAHSDQHRILCVKEAYHLWTI